MTNANFCDLHPDPNTSLIRGDKSHVHTLVLQSSFKEVGKDGKKVTWTREAKINACQKCFNEQILQKLKANNVELEYDEYRLTSVNGKFTRMNRSPEEQSAQPANA